jgi:hypothetical protein
VVRGEGRKALQFICSALGVKPTSRIRAENRLFCGAF